MAHPVQLDYAERELLYNRFMEPALSTAINSLALPSGSQGLDAGCGPGGVLHLLDNAIGSVGHIVGIDISKAHLEAAQQQIGERGIGARVYLTYADLSQPLPFATSEFDWVWIADVLSSGAEARGFADPVDVVRELARVVKPGGTVAVFLGNWLGAMFIPGHAHIEQCLDTAVELHYHQNNSYHPSLYHENVLSWLRRAGLVQLKVSAHITEYQYPLKPELVHYIREYIFEGEYKSTPELKQLALRVGLSEADWATWLDISNPNSPDYLLDNEDYYCVQFGTLTTGRVLA
jgi:ubiquinone/menaquinone biosynthesis C-methylase UbiE